MSVVECAMMYLGVFFFFKQKTAYEMRISDWSSDVCSSDLDLQRRDVQEEGDDRMPVPRQHVGIGAAHRADQQPVAHRAAVHEQKLVVAHAAKIGRASCRERVCQYV